MSNNNGSSQSLTQKIDECVSKHKVTDQFISTMRTAFAATKQVLKTRKKNLEAWTNDDQNDFEEIFGLKGKTSIIIDYYTPGQRVDGEGKIIPSHKETTAYEFIKSGVDRMIFICDSLNVGPRQNKNNQIICGNFANLTVAGPKGAARIPPLQTTHIDLKHNDYKNNSPENTLRLEYQKRITVDILQRFIHQDITGEDSQASTLCHELSHLLLIWDGERYYGGLSSNDLGEGNEVANARDLRDKLDPKVFKNAYNIEKYFEIVIPSNKISD
ncbi:hypothetical protein ACVUCS_004534 [Salmonella enterica subsp. enterica]|nr:hypothetical protein [Salmonella enterica subsp. enterica serovar Baguida]